MSASPNLITTPQRTTPHYRLTLEGAIRDYQDGLLTAKGLIFYAIGCMRRIGQGIRIRVSHFCRKLGIARSTFYKAIASLDEDLRITMIDPGEVTVAIPVSTTEGIPDYLLIDELSTNGDTLPTNGNTLSTNGNTLSTIVDNHRPKPAPDVDSGTLQLLQLDQSLSSEGEREAEVDPEFRDWLVRKAAKLPTPPALLEQWIDRQVQNESNLKEFQVYKQTLAQRANFPPPAPSNLKIEPMALDRGELASQRLGMLSYWWESGQHDRVRGAIATHPDWGIRLVGDRLVCVEGES